MAISPPNSLLDSLRQHRLLDTKQLEELTSLDFPDPKALAGELIRRDWITPYQANQLLNGKGQELVLGSYILLERLGEGGMGQVFKARHRNLGRISAIKLIRKERLAMFLDRGRGDSENRRRSRRRDNFCLRPCTRKIFCRSRGP